MKRIVLMYHDVGKDSGFRNPTAMKYKVAPDIFESHLSRLRDWMQSNNVEKDKVVFTFDDGGVSFLTQAAPILEKYGFRGIFFIATKFIGTSGFLTAEQIRELARRGHRIGSHSHSHPDRISALSNTDIRHEWSESQRILTEILEKTPIEASIPNGYSSAAVIRAMKSSGIREIYTSEPTTRTAESKGCTIYGRYAITDTDTPQDVISIAGSSIKRLKLKARSDLLGLAKQLLGPAYLSIRNLLVK